jgi:hypothetical protein
MATPSVCPAPARRRASTALWLGAVVLALSACGATTTTTPVSPPVEAPAAGKVPPAAGKAHKAPSGQASPKTARSTLVTDGAFHFSVRLPAGYKQLNKAGVSAALKAGGAANPKLKPIIDQYASMGKNVRVFAYKMDTNRSASNVNVLAIPARGATSDSFESAFRQAKPGLEKFGARITVHRPDKVGGKSAMRVEYRLSTPAQRLRGTQVYFIHKDRLFVVTITQPDVEASSADAKAILGGLRLL